MQTSEDGGPAMLMGPSQMSVGGVVFVVRSGPVGPVVLVGVVPNKGAVFMGDIVPGCILGLRQVSGFLSVDRW